MEMKNVDDVLIKSMYETDQNTQSQETHVEKIDNQEQSGQANIENNDVSRETNDNSSENDPYLNKNEQKNDEKSSEKDDVSRETNSDNPIDEYGIPVEKSKLYTDEEVNNIIRDRLSRGKYSDQNNQEVKQVQQDARDFQADPDSEDSWEVQLESFIDRTIQKKQREYERKRWENDERSKQAEFESKFTTGMSKYADFHKVVADKPFTDDMMLAVRSLENPAAFVYAASKLHPNEIDRISRIKDTYAQASELGRLHERMIKDKRTATNASRPLETPRSDIATPIKTQPSLDERISAHAKQKFARK